VLVFAAPHASAGMMTSAEVKLLGAVIVSSSVCPEPPTSGAISAANPLAIANEQSAINPTFLTIWMVISVS
jgi:hypothetical protein